MNKRLYSSILIGLLFCLSFASAATFEEASNTALDKQVSGQFGKFTQALFKTSDLSIENVIILYVIFAVIFFVLADLISAIPIFSSNAISYFMAFLVSILISISGAYSLSAAQLFAFINIFTSGSWSILALVLTVLLIAMIGCIFWLIIERMKKTSKKSDAYAAGFKFASDIGLIRKR